MKGSIQQEFVVLSPDKKASIERCDATLYERLDKNYNGFGGHELISCHEFSTNWSSWEIHPNGDEVVILLAGRATFILQLAEGEQTQQLAEVGDYIVVPKNIWHTVHTNVKTRLLFITPGEGTQNKDV